MVKPHSAINVDGQLSAFVAIIRNQTLHVLPSGIPRYRTANPSPLQVAVSRCVHSLDGPLRNIGFVRDDSDLGFMVRSDHDILRRILRGPGHLLLPLELVAL